MLFRVMRALVPCSTVLVLVLVLPACGGGGNNSSSAADGLGSPADGALVSTVKVSPALGGVSAGVLVKLYDGSSGALLAQGLTQSAPLGMASLALRNFQGTLVVKVEGADGATYYDERSGTAQPFAPGKVLLSVVPNLKLGRQCRAGRHTADPRAGQFAGPYARQLWPPGPEPARRAADRRRCAGTR